MTSAVGGRGTLAGSTCIGDGGLTAGAVGVAGLANGAGMDGITVKEGDEKNWGGS